MLLLNITHTVTIRFGASRSGRRLYKAFQDIETDSSTDKLSFENLDKILIRCMQGSELETEGDEVEDVDSVFQQVHSAMQNDMRFRAFLHDMFVPIMTCKLLRTCAERL